MDGELVEGPGLLLDAVAVPGGPVPQVEGLGGGHVRVKADSGGPVVLCGGTAVRSHHTVILENNYRALPSSHILYSQSARSRR